jgi:branched-chain amino acid transport system permease protein
MSAWELFSAQLPQQLVNAVWLGGVYALFALGYTLVFGVLDLLNLAHGSVFMWGAYFGLVAVTSMGLPVWLALPVAMLGAGFVGILLERLAYKPLRQAGLGTAVLWVGFLIGLVGVFRLFNGRVNWIFGIVGGLIILVGLWLDYKGVRPGLPRQTPHLASLISTIGAGTVMVTLSQSVFGAQQSRFPFEAFPNQVYTLGPVSVTLLQIIIFSLSLLLMAGLSLYVFRSKTGQAMRAVAYSQRTASLLGIHVDKIFVQTFFLSSALAGAAGVLHGLAFNAVTPFMGAPVQLKGLTVIVLGGLGNIGGAVLGGFVVALLEVFSVAAGQSNFRDAIVFTLLFIMLLVRPQGLLGKKAETRD